MPCPYFEPRHIARNPAHPNARLPLIEEYDGVCHAGAESAPVPEAARFRCCNHGYSQGECGRMPAAEKNSCSRFGVLRRADDCLDLIYLEEQDYAPARMQRIRFSISTGALDPEVTEPCARAQVQAFCRSYVRRFPQ